VTEISWARSATRELKRARALVQQGVSQDESALREALFAIDRACIWLLQGYLRNAPDIPPELKAKTYEKLPFPELLELAARFAPIDASQKSDILMFRGLRGRAQYDGQVPPKPRVQEFLALVDSLATLLTGQATSPTGRDAEELGDQHPKAYVATWPPDRGVRLKMPDGFRHLFNGEQIDWPIKLVDESGRSYAVIYNRRENFIFTTQLMPWVRDRDPHPGDQIVITAIDVGERVYSIALQAVGRSEEFGDEAGLYVGMLKDRLGREATRRKYFVAPGDLVTHVFICGITGTGKTVLGKALVEECVLKGIPCILVDLKGDITSLAFPAYPLTEKHFEELVDVAHEDRRRGTAQAAVERYRQAYEEFEIPDERLSSLAEKASVAVFTPRLGPAIPLAVTPFGISSSILELASLDRVEADKMVGALAGAFVKSLFPEKKMGRLSPQKTLLETAVWYALENGESLDGLRGLQTLAELVSDPPFTHVGTMPVDSFLSANKRNELAARLTIWSTGEQRLWYTGVPLDVRLLLSRPEGSGTPVTIINVSHLSIDDQMYVIAALAYAIFNWARSLGDAAGEPRLVFFLDEVGGGGGKLAFYPSRPQDPPSKSGIDLLLRQGRAFGICCILATQNPGQVDYMGLSNCRTWIIGQLQTERDRKKVREGFSTADLIFSRIEDRLASLSDREFLIKRREGEPVFLVERWLLSYHKTLTEQQLRGINVPELEKWFRNLVITAA